MTKTDEIVRLAQEVAADSPAFFKVQRPGAGNRETNAFMAELHGRVVSAIGPGYEERRICGTNKLAVDFYVPEEEVIVEVALGLKNPNSEFERDVLKAVLAQDNGHAVERLVFVCKPGGALRTGRAGAMAITSWVEQHHRITVEVRELQERPGN